MGADSKRLVAEPELSDTILLRGEYHMVSYDLSDHDLLKREVKRLPLQAQVLFPIEAPFLQSHGVSDSCSLWDIGCGDGSWLHLFRSAFPNSATTGLRGLITFLGSFREEFQNNG